MELVAKKTKRKMKINKDKQTGTVCLSPGLSFMLGVSTLFIVPGVILITYTEPQNVHYWSYGSEVYGTEFYQPYQTPGIVLAAVGGLFLIAGIPLTIVGAVYLYKAFRSRRAGKKDPIMTRLSFNFNYNLYNKQCCLTAGYKF